MEVDASEQQHTNTAHPELLEGLTEPQRQAVTHTEGPVLVLAAAGSGKTRVITRRAAYLVAEIGIPAWQILSITFTNKAAGEMRQRVADQLGERAARAMTVGTFHAFCARLLRQYPEPAGVNPDYVIYDQSDQKRAMKEAFKELDLSTNHFTPDAILSTVSTAKNELVDAEAYAADAGDFYSKTVARLYTRYQAILDRAGALDFDDLLMRVAVMLRRDEATRTALQERFAYVQIDEYQDTNHAQFIIAHCLAAAHRNICAVGDPDQSIYAWRGADLSNILDFEKHYPDTTVIKLGQNYRSTPEVLGVADHLIQFNRQRRHKPLFTENPAGDSVAVVQASNEEHESEQVVQFLRQRREAGMPWGQMAVFYRVNSLSRVIEDAMLRGAIPYQVARGTAFYQRKEIKDTLAYLRVTANPDDEVGLLRIINTPTRGIGDTTIKQVQAHAVASGRGLWAVLREPSAVGSLTKRAVTAIGRFVDMIKGWRQKLGGGPGDGQMFAGMSTVQEMVENVLCDSGLEAFYRSEKTGDEEKLANLYELVTAARRFDAEYGEADATPAKRLHDYLEAVSLVADVDAVDHGNAGDGAVTLMTLHAAKGLEFDAVAMIGLEEGLLPHSRALESESELEEERRLCFVGITRARQSLQMSHARYRTIRGLHQRTVPSVFLSQLGDEGVEVADLSGGLDEWGDPEDTDDHAWSDPAPQVAPGGLVVGALVRHAQFGLGRVESLMPTSAPTKTRVRFQTVGFKTLVLEYARLEVIDPDEIY